MLSRPGQRLLAAVLLAGLALRLGWGLSQTTHIDRRLPDQLEYLSLGANLLAGRGLMFHDARFDQDIYAYRTPGYPLFLAACGASPVAVRVVQAFLDISIALAAYVLARRGWSAWLGGGEEGDRKKLDIRSERWAIVAAALVAFNPFLVYFSGLILSETLFAAMLMWGLVGAGAFSRSGVGCASAHQSGSAFRAKPAFLWWCAEAHPTKHSEFWGMLGVAILALSILVRPAALFLPIVVAAVAPAARFRQRMARVGIAVLLIVLVLLPWAIRNRVVLGRWVWLTTNGGITQYDGFNPGATGASDQRFLQRRDFGRVRDMNEVERDEYFSKLASEQIRTWLGEKPGHLISLAARKLGRTWTPVPLSSEFGSRRVYLFIAAAFSIPFDLLIVLGLIAGRFSWRFKVLLLAPALYFSAVHALSVGSLRYRIPSEPPLAIIAAAGVGRLKKPRMHMWSSSGTRAGKQG